MRESTKVLVCGNLSAGKNSKIWSLTNVCSASIMEISYLDRAILRRWKNREKSLGEKRMESVKE